MKNVKMTVAYEGTHYRGWQKTPMGPSIEETLEKVLAQVVRHPVSLQAASRTDAGVHAEGQVVNFWTDSTLSFERLQKSFNSLLPPDIVTVQLEQAPDTFHPTLDCRGKEYWYSICLGPTQLPFLRRFSWHFVYPIDVKLMVKAAPFFKGEHDFSAMTSELRGDNVRTVFDLGIEKLSPSELRIRVSGNNFLYKMVRSIVGTLVYVGCGKISVEEIPPILEGRDRRRGGITAPAHGLVLKRVIYDPS